MNKHTQSELQSQTNAEELTNKNSSNEPVETWQYIEGTPFHCKGNDTDGYVATMSNYIVTEPKETIEELEDYVRSKPWELIVTLINIVMNIRETILKEAAKNNTNG